ncbi:MAG: SDR family NAD(P)-dependent oxidoreductase [Chloroflexi bacterium]|nr:SDR family NAD(P)-dependent oxidoreductase [Chloroflexota bacterium]
MSRIRDAVVLLTGASSGIGAATARALAQEGARLSLAARRADALEALADELRRDYGAAVHWASVDVTDADQVQAWVRDAHAHFGRVDIAIANAGQYVRRPVTEWRVEDFQRSCAVNFYGALHLILAAQPIMLAQGQGHFVLVSSLDAKKGLPPDGPYVAAKYALSGIGGVMRQELAPLGIQVTVVYPGRVDTPMIADLEVPRISAKLPPEKVARAIVRGIRRNKAEVIVPWMGYLLYLDCFAPRLADFLVRKLNLAGRPRAS